MKTEDEIFEEVAQNLATRGLSAGAQDTGGGMLCVVVDRAEGGEIAWGTSDVNWGAVIIGRDGEIEASISTTCPSSSEDIEAIASAILAPSIRAGAAV